MYFDEKKLVVESIESLLQCRIDTVAPYALMLAPVYVFMKLNDKLVSVKAPLDFFTAEELERLKHYEVFYIPKFLQSGTRFQTAAKLSSRLINFDEGSKKLKPAPFEVSNEVIHTVASLWGRDFRIEPYFLAVFADELCGSLNPDLMLHARETAVVRHEAGILLSGALVFLLLHLGWFDLSLLNQIRTRVYTETVEQDKSYLDATSEWELVARDLKILLARQDYFDILSLEVMKSEWSKKIVGRLRHVSQSINLKHHPSVSIRDEGGLAS